ncbi:membrane protein insertase YidC [Asticcacaulis sp. BYS171W]|uniref:Membrane protein insertase YidC n=1 Tax=Asticcacaulis aquaticus TaxID=2984212 RepID=A0ABT5HQZ8_9CAUL|nr:membrane protein insertase YidC [Asticcacaulis aquaticus]MDC7682497.1 membrane protein insertase YidC [Asticcacaulis aquaticus]
MKRDDNRNMFIFLALSLAILFGYQYFVQGPKLEKERAAAMAAKKAEAAKPAAVATPESLYVEGRLPRDQALAQTPRVQIDSPALKGSLSLSGARIDDLYLKSYKDTLDKNSPLVELYRPQGAEHAYYAESGWVGQNVAGVPAGNSVWTVLSGTVLSPGKTVVLGYDAGTGLTFERTLSLDDKYMITVTDKVINGTAAAVTLAPYANIIRQGAPATLGKNMILHEGGIGAFSKDKGYTVPEFKFHNWEKDAKKKAYKADSTGGWMGLTDKYWLAAVIPDQTTKIHAAMKATDQTPADEKDFNFLYQAGYVAEPVTIQPGQPVSISYKIYSGAKQASLLSAYQEQYKLPAFDKAIDWGMFWFLTRPMFWVLDHLFGFLGNFGLAILGLTVIVKLIFFPLAHKSYESMTKMKLLQPKVEELKKKHEGNAQQMQIEMMNLYQKEKVNPMSGCLPIFVQIPVFYALYKVLFVTIEMRHAPFFGWIQDLSARDPSTLFNLFGLLPYDPATIPLIGGLMGTSLHIGILPILYGASMALSQSMNPPMPDPMQRRIFQLMPIMFTFIMAPFAAGLLIYWIWNNVLTVAQQYALMRQMGVENPIDTFLGKVAKTKPKSEAAHTIEVAEEVIHEGEVIQPSKPKTAGGTKRARTTPKKD